MCFCKVVKSACVFDSSSQSNVKLRRKRRCKIEKSVLINIRGPGLESLGNVSGP